MFQIDLSSMEPGVHHVSRTVAPQALGEAARAEGEEEASGEDEEESPAVSEDVDFGPVQVDAVLDYEPDQVLVTLEAQATARMTCDRTLRRFDAPVSGQYAILFAEPSREAPEESEAHDELRDLPPGMRHLDLTEAVRDTLLLAIPQRKVAPGAEGEEIDTTFGAPERDDDAPADPRFAKLRELRDAPSEDAPDEDAAS